MINYRIIRVINKYNNFFFMPMSGRIFSCRVNYTAVAAGLGLSEDVYTSSSQT